MSKYTEGLGPGEETAGQNQREAMFMQYREEARRDAASIAFEAAIIAANPPDTFSRPGTNSMDLYAHFIPMLWAEVPGLIADPEMTDQDILERIKSSQKYYYSTAGEDPKSRYDIPDQALLDFIAAYRKAEQSETT